jgi:hypothetical protein
MTLKGPAPPVSPAAPVHPEQTDDDSLFELSRVCDARTRGTEPARRGAGTAQPLGSVIWLPQQAVRRAGKRFVGNNEVDPPLFPVAAAAVASSFDRETLSPTRSASRNSTVSNRAPRCTFSVRSV